jgi:hypothetical protein
MLEMVDAFAAMEKKNGEVVIGDVEYDGRVILYIIKGSITLFNENVLSFY